jgi:hypothetical protein
VLADQTVVVEGGRISALGPRAEVSVPTGATLVEGRGRYLLPGLSDMHAHISGYVTDAASDKDAVARSELLLYAATGVTLVRNMSGSDAHVDYRRRVASGELVGPRMVTATNIVDGPKPVWPTAIKMSDPAAADDLVAGFVRDGYDQIKIYNELPREVYAALFDAAARRGIRVVGHVPFSVGIDAALAAEQYSIEHQRGYDYDSVRPQALVLNGGRNAERFSSWQRMSDDRMRDLVRKTVGAGTWNCPTFVVDDMMSNTARRAEVGRHESIRFVHPAVRATILSNDLDKMFPKDANDALRHSFPQKYKLLKMLSDAGAGFYRHRHHGAVPRTRIHTHRRDASFRESGAHFIRPSAPAPATRRVFSGSRKRAAPSPWASERTCCWSTPTLSTIPRTSGGRSG